MAEERVRNPETVARLADLALETNRRQLATADALDSKAWQVFGSGSIIVGLGVVGDIGGWELVLPLGAYLAMAVASLMCLAPTAFSVPPATWGLWEDQWWRPKESLDHTIVNALIKGERKPPDGEGSWVKTVDETNADVLSAKANALNWAFRFLALETLALVIAAAI